MYDEGVIKFTVRHEEKPLEERTYLALACELIAWREILAKTRLVGRQPGLYGGFGYGNVSGRLAPPSRPRRRRRFLITATQTSGKPCMTLSDFCAVESWDLERNRVQSRGPAMPSSESLTHGAIYDLGSHIRFVFHAHSPVIWRRARQLRIPTSAAEVRYGTPEMARDVERLYRATALGEMGILAMGGHEDGILVFGRTAEDAGQVLLRYLARAYEAECAAAGGLCAV